MGSKWSGGEQGRPAPAHSAPPRRACPSTGLMRVDPVQPIPQSASSSPNPAAATELSVHTLGGQGKEAGTSTIQTVRLAT